MAFLAPDSVLPHLASLERERKSPDKGAWEGGGVKGGQWGGLQFWGSAPLHITSGGRHLPALLASKTQSLWRSLPFPKQPNFCSVLPAS